MQDYNYMYAGCMEITLEISCCKFPNATELPDFWTANKDALINYLLEGTRGKCNYIHTVVYQDYIVLVCYYRKTYNLYVKLFSGM